MPTTAYLYVIAPAGSACPAEMSRLRITDAKIVPVVDTTYYRRRIQDGSLIAKSEADYKAQIAPKNDEATEAKQAS